MSTPFDNHKYAKRLMEAGMQPALAEIQAETTGQLFNELSQLSIKLQEVETRCNAKIEQAELRLEVKIAEVRTEVVRWVVGIAILQSSLLTGFMLKLIH
ncbi:hypothetical protein SAMN05216319_3193 [Duganella sp. CF402]|uniref:hypothetical protein n=1 Tax=unclassified Duganella TaxID=2636909 RepID=UPI0008CA37E2|nr:MULTISPECIES: hypothetical protein [unclassified Duganella]RZT08394.1 hypothetical protein EV582_0426 [Duganella sp. BK701]SEL95541.1 hypothetical protein SAMN05216319_3193 [Duganella sp. CF402]